MTSLIRATDADTNQIKPFMPSDLFPNIILLHVFSIKVYADLILTGLKIHLLAL